MKILTINPIIAAALVSCGAAQLIKAIAYAVRNQKISLKRLLGAGGTPSAHAALITAAAIMCLRICGIDSTEFGLAVLIAGVVMYDTAGVRYNAGLHAAGINRLRKYIGSLVEKISANKDFVNEKPLNELLGSRPIGVIAGAALGAVIALILPTK